MNNLEKFGKILKDLRIEKELSLREACKLTSYDPSNWSKIERGLLPPPATEKVLKKWAKILGLSQASDKFTEFIDKAMVAQGIIPQDILAQKDAIKYMPAFFRTLRNKKPTKEDINKLVRLIKDAQ